MKRKLPEILTEEEILKIIKATNKPKYKLMVALGFYQGMRVSEIANLKLENVDKNMKLLRIKQAKGSKDRNIPIAKEVYKGLKHLPIGIKIRAMQTAFKKLVKKAGITKDIHFHSLRHSGATFYRRIRKWDIRELQVFLGHSDISTTQIYDHISPQNLMDKMGWD